MAQAFYHLNKDHSLSHEAIASMVGKSRATVTNLLRLLNLSDEVRALLIEGQLEMGHARSLLALLPEQQVVLAQKIVKKKLTVRDAERLVQLSKQPKDSKPIPFAREVDAWVKKLSRSLSSKVEVNINNKGEGKVVIHFSSPDEVDWLVEYLADNIEVKQM